MADTIEHWSPVLGPHGVLMRNLVITLCVVISALVPVTCPVLWTLAMVMYYHNVRRYIESLLTQTPAT